MINRDFSLTAEIERHNPLKTDFHTHSTFSPDGDHTPEEMCRTALALGLEGIAFTEHAEWLFGQNGFPKVEPYFEEIARCKALFAPQGLHVLSGVEMGNPHEFPQEAAALLARYPFEVKIGSIHAVDGCNIHAADCFAERDPEEVLVDYFRQMGRMAAECEFDIVAHFDRIFWRATLLGVDVNPFKFEEVIQDALARIVGGGKILELNSRFTKWQAGNWNEALVTILGWYREQGGEQILINSDAHRITDLRRNFDVAWDLARQAGF